MASYIVEIDPYDISSDAMLLDTNVLVGAFDPSDRYHDDANCFIMEYPYQWLVPIAVIIETWGILVGRSKKFYAGFNFLKWINTPGSVVVIDNTKDKMSEEATLINEFRIDCVDAILMLLATDIGVKCGYKELPVATYDTKDFMKVIGTSGFHFDVFDMRTLDRVLHPTS